MSFEPLQILGTAAMMTLAVICIKMAYPKQNALYLAVGQTVFKWLFVALMTLSIGRLLTFFHAISAEVARYINSGAFMLVVVFIVISVLTYNREGLVDGFGKLLKTNKVVGKSDGKSD